jgi:plastocyanin
MTQPPKRLQLMAALVLWSGALLPTAAASGAAPSTHRGQLFVVHMKGFAFSRSALTIRVGDRLSGTYDQTVTDVPPGWASPASQNPAGSCPGHSVTSSGIAHNRRLFDSGVHRVKGFPYTLVFKRAGTLPYLCTVHGGPQPNNPLSAMNGQVTVAVAS